MSMLVTARAPSSNGFASHQEDIFLRCPNCEKTFGSIPTHDCDSTVGKMPCAECGFLLEKINGVWRTLTPEQQASYEGFLREYEAIRRKEGRGSNQAAFYLALPFSDLTRRFAWQWKIRAKSFRMIERSMLPTIEAEYPGGLRILDLGAGNGWLSYRLSLRAHSPVAVDLSANPWDGLEAARHYQPVLFHFFPRVQAAMDRLPFADAQFDLAIFNASLHYSSNYRKTLTETLRCLTARGKILIVDFPTYQSTDSGMEMRRELHRQFEQQYGFRSDHLGSQTFLTPSMLEDLADLGIDWQRFSPRYGLAWSMRPWIAKWKGRREPSNFYIYLGHMRKA
jgi:ubiquinone/menaquinone biosynthesis C-methylase UbiE